MKKLLFVLLAGSVLLACNRDAAMPGNPAGGIVSSTPTIDFEEVLLLINIKATDTTYLTVDRIDSVRLFINSSYWATVNSVKLDTSKIDKTPTNNQFESTTKLDYLVIAQEESGEPELSTAGDFSAYLNESVDLPPGEYVCFIESFQVKMRDSSVQTIYPYTYQTFKVEDDSKSAFVGTFSIQL